MKDVLDEALAVLDGGNQRQSGEDAARGQGDDEFGQLEMGDEEAH